MESRDLEKFLPLRGEITRVFMYNFELSNEEIFDSFYSCENYAIFLHSSLIVFDWSNVLLENYFLNFKRHPSGFCIGEWRIKIIYIFKCKLMLALKKRMQRA